MAEETERRAPLRSPRARVGVPPAAPLVQGVPPYPDGQGAPPRLQGEAGDSDKSLIAWGARFGQQYQTYLMCNPG